MKTPPQFKRRHHHNSRGALSPLPQLKTSLAQQVKRNSELCAVLKRNISKCHNFRGSPSPLLQLERNPEFTTAILKDPEPPTTTQEEAPPELERNSESSASTQEEVSWKMEIRPQHN